MAAAKLLLFVALIAIVGGLIVGCSGGDEKAANVGEVSTSKEGAAAIKANGGKPMPKAVPSVDD